jgi:hypothetical protein
MTIEYLFTTVPILLLAAWGLIDIVLRTYYEIQWRRLPAKLCKGNCEVCGYHHDYRTKWNQKYYCSQ